MYLTRQLKIVTTLELQGLSHEAGIVYSKALVTYRRVLRKKNIFLSKNSMQRLVRNKNLHSQTVQGVIDILYDNLSSYWKVHKNDKRARLPKRRKWFFVIPYKASAIRLKNSKLILSNGKGNTPLILDWKFEKPNTLEISWDGKQYKVNAVYQTCDPVIKEGGLVAGVDLGEIHLAVANINNIKNTSILLNGRIARSKRQYRNKILGSYQNSLSKLKKGSRKWKKLSKKKKSVLKKLDNQIKDVYHKQTTKFVQTLNNMGVCTVAIGDVRNIRKNVNYGKFSNQKIHQMPSGEIRRLLEYKFKKVGIRTEILSEAYTSQTCPKCLKRHKPFNRTYKCSCGFESHRDVVGAFNIRQLKVSGTFVPVVGAMTSPIGIRYYSNESPLLKAA